MDTIRLTRELVYLCLREVNSFSLPCMSSSQLEQWSYFSSEPTCLPLRPMATESSLTAFGLVG